jgi:hypothetical protein
MKKTSLILISILALSVAIGQTPAPTAQPVAQPAQQYVLVPAQQVAPTPPPAPVPTVVQQVVQKAVPNQFADIGSAIGSGLNGLVESVGGATGKTIDKTGEVTSQVVDKSGKVASAVMDRTFGKDVTLVDGIDKVSKTDAGRFTMLVIAWKVMGKDAVDLLNKVQGVMIGVPIQIFLVCLYVWVMRRFFVTRSVVLTKTGGLFSKDRKVEYGLVNVTSGYNNKDEVKIISRIDEDTKHVGLFITSVVFIGVSILNIAQVIF